MTLSTKVAYLHTGIPWHCLQNWHTHRLVYYDTVGKSGMPTHCSLSFPFLYFLLDISIFCTDAYISVQASHPDKKTVHCQVHSYLYTDSLTRTSYMTVFAWISPLMWRLLLFELVSGVMLIFRLIHLLRTYSFIMSFFITIVISMGLFAQLWIEGSRL